MLNDRNKTIFIVTGGMGSGGLEKITSTLANIYSKKGWNVVVVCLLEDSKTSFYPLNKNVILTCFKWSGFYKKKKRHFFNVFNWIKFLKSLRKKYNPSIVLAMTLRICSLCMFAFRLKNTRVVLREISDPKSVARSKISNFISFLVCHKVSSIIFQTEWEKQCYPKKLRNKGTVIPNPINVDIIGKPYNDKFIVTVGRLENQSKRHDILLKSFKFVLEKFPDFILKVYGEGPDLCDDIEMVKNLGISKNVEFCGAKKDVLNCISTASCFVLSSEYEGFSNALAEAYSIGIPCVSTNWNGVEDIITDNVDGLIVKRNDPLNMCYAICKILGNQEFGNLLSRRAIHNAVRFKKDLIYDKYQIAIEGDIHG